MNGAIEAVIGGGIGYGAGQYFQHRSIEAAAQLRQGLFASYDNVPVPEHRGFLKRLIFSEQALTLAMSGIALASAIAPAGIGSSESVGPTQAIENLDFNYSFSKANGNVTTEDEPAHLENSVVGKLFGTMPNFYLRVANDDKIVPVTSNTQLESLAPYGSPEEIQDGINTDLETGFIDSPLEQSNLLSTNEARSGALLIFDDNTSIGNPTTIEGEASSAGNIPIYVVNVGGSNTSTNTKNLEKVATATHGHYWNLNAGDVKGVVSDIKSTIHVSGSEGKSGNNPDRYVWLSVTGLGLLATRAIYRRQIKSGAIASS